MDRDFRGIVLLLCILALILLNIREIVLILFFMITGRTL